MPIISSLRGLREKDSKLNVTQSYFVRQHLKTETQKLRN